MEIGIDIEEVNRFEYAYHAYVEEDEWENFLNSAFTKNELKYAEESGHESECLAGMWCAKEAAKKIFPDVEMKAIEIEHQLGKPFILVHRPEINSKDLKVSISHTKKYATAVVIRE